MNAWTLPLLNFSIACLAISNVLCAWEVRKLSRRVFRLELDKMAREAAANFIKDIHERITSNRTAQDMDAQHGINIH